MSSMDAGIAIFVCRCGGEIKSINFEKLEKHVKDSLGTSEVYFFNELCRDPSAIRGNLKGKNVKGVIVAGCSLYREALIDAVESAGVNPLSLELVPIRELFLPLSRESSGPATLKLTLMICSLFNKINHLEPELLREVKPMKIKTQSKITRRSLFKALPQALTVYEPAPVISREKCLGASACKFCIDACPRKALSDAGDGRLVLNYEQCNLCGVCVAVCPTGAIQIPNSTDEQLDAQIRSLLTNYREETQNRIIMFISSDDYNYLLSRLVDRKLSLPLGVFPIELPTLGLMSENVLLSSIIYGASGIIILLPRNKNNLGYLHILYHKVHAAKNIMKSVGLGPDRITLLEFDEQDIELLVEKLNEISSDTKAKQSRIFTTEPITGDRRSRLVSMIKTLLDGRRPISDIVEYGGSIPFGEVVIDREKCTLCELCYNKCPAKAFTLVKEADTVSLGFIYQKCIGCDFCSSICPENAISLRKYLSISRLLDDSVMILVSQEIVKCLRCGRPFITRGKLRKIEKIYEGIGAGNVDKLQSLKLCPECKRTKVVPAEYDKWLIYR